MNSRRDFFKKWGAATFAALLGQDAKATDIITQLTENQAQSDFWQRVRKQFTIPDNFTYFNTGTIGISPQYVVQSICKSLMDNEMYGHYEGWELAREKLARFVGVETEHLSLTHNTTEGINIVANGLPLRRGDEIIMTAQEHAGNALPWLLQAERKHLKIKVFEPQKTAADNLNRINDLMTKRTKVLAIPHITCTLGTQFPVREIADLARSKNTWFLVDGAHALGSKQLNISDINCDFYAMCCHKWLLGAKGTGCLYVNPAMLDVLQPTHAGAHSTLDWTLTTQSQHLQAFVPTAHRYDYGTQSAPIWKGVVAAIEFMELIGMDRVEEYTQDLATYLLEKLLQKPDIIEVLTPTETQSRAAMVGFRSKKETNKELASRLKGIRVRQVPEAQLNSIRISTHIYNNENEIDRLLEQL